MKHHNDEIKKAPGRQLNPVTGKMVQRVRPSTKGTAWAKKESKREYYRWEHLSSIVLNYSPIPAQQENLELLITKLWQVQMSYAYREKIKFKDSRARLHSDTLKTLCGDNYTEAIGYLIEKEVVEKVFVKKHYIPNLRRRIPIMGYRLIGEDTYKRFTRKKIQYALNDRRLTKYYKRKESRLDRTSHAVFQKIKRVEFDLTRDEIESYMPQMHERYVRKRELKNSRNPKKSKPVMTLDEYRDQYTEYYWQEIQRWNNSAPSDRIDWFSVDTFGNRLHHLMTRIPRELRKKIRIDGKNVKLVGLDLKASQPCFAALLLREFLPEYGHATCRFLKDVEAHALYERVALHLDTENINEAKTELIRWMFCHPEYSSGQERFEDYDPKAAEIFADLKEVGDSTLDYDERHKFPAKMMQQVESKVFRIIWAKLIQQKIFMIPVHDCIYCREEDAKRVKGIMRSILKKELKMEVKINEE